MPDLNVPPEVLIRRVGKLLDTISTELEYGSLLQLFVPRINKKSGAISLVTHKDLSRVNTVHEKKFWKYHDASCRFSAYDPRRLAGFPGRCFPAEAAGVDPERVLLSRWSTHDWRADRVPGALDHCRAHLCQRSERDPGDAAGGD